MQDFLAGGGEMGELIRTFDWSKTPLGSIATWPRSLRTCVQIMLTSRQPIWIGWGKDLVKLYNDPYKEIVKGKHPWALGKPASLVWKDIWKDIESMLDNVMYKNEGTYVEEQLLIMERNGYPEETYYTFSYTPVAGDDGQTGGMICFNTDDTDRIISERQLKTLTQLGKLLNDLRSIDQVFQESIKVLRENSRDFPFALLYQTKDDQSIFVNATSLDTPFESKYPAISDNSIEEVPLLFSKSVKKGKAEILSDLKSKVGVMPQGAWEVPPEKALIIPIAQRGNKDAYGHLVVGVNPFSLLDDKYLGFFQLVSDQIAGSLANIYAIEEERKRLEALAEIDRAKTVFFSNISHEFRTPLTLMLGSLEQLLNKPEDQLSTEDKTTVETTHRNAIRLLRLVNNLLDFSKIEAGREKASFQQTDIATFTRQLASNFSSLIENAGLSYVLDIKPSNHLVYVDKLMWEKIVLNLVSNAFKYTLKGSIKVSLYAEDGHIILKVIDTGVGIPKEELPKMFERFHRVQNITGRTHEGTGIGLSLVGELVKFHKGKLSVTSEVGLGSEFTVIIPTGDSHIDKEQIIIKEDEHSTSLSETFLDEASSLINGYQNSTEDPVLPPSQPDTAILVVDDNPDMRDYIKNLLQYHFQVVTATNGLDALEKIKSSKPDLVLSDIMMPLMDGVQLMRALKADSDTQRIPVILLSARAGEEAKIEGYETGADDYLVKPFSAKELIARITSQVKLFKVRREVESNLRNVISQSPVATTLLRGSSFIVELVNGPGLELWGRSYGEVINKPLAVALPEVGEQGFINILDNVYSTGVPFKGNEVPVQLLRFGKPQIVYLNFIYTPLRNDEGKIIGIIAVGIDVSEQVYSRQIIEDAKSALNNAVELADLGTWEIDLKSGFTTFSPRVAAWWGLPEEGAPLQDVINCMHPDDRDKVTASLAEAVDKTGRYEAEYRLINAFTNDEKFVQARGNVSYDEEKQPRKLTGIVRDITLHKLTQNELERQVRERTKELQALNEDLRRSNSELMQFAYVSSHDLQEPLRKIRTFSDLARNGKHGTVITDELKTYLNKIDNSAARMSSLISDVLMYSKISKEGMRFENIDLNDVLTDVLTDFELVIDQKKAVVQAERLPVLVGNRVLFHQLFSNLVGNSLKFSEHDPMILISHRVVDGTSEIEQGGLPIKGFHELTFKDNGIGFDQNYADQIFGLFTRLHHKKEFGGTGIGLALCKKIVENLNGYIKAESTSGQGAVFTVLLPLKVEL